MTSGVYKIVHRPTGATYIGQSKNIEKRWKQHRSNLTCNRHDSRRLQEVFNISRQISDFDFIIVEVLPPDVNLLLEREEACLYDHAGQQNALNANRKLGNNNPTLSHVKESIIQVIKSMFKDAK